MKLVVGLGNPGDKYQDTRHNLGFELLDEFRRMNNLENWDYQDKFKAEIIKIGTDLILARPQTFVNESGLAVAALANFFKINPVDVVIVHDDLDLVLGRVKVRLGGSGAGHHGVESVIKALGTDQFTRVRLGIGPAQGPAENFVLAQFKPQEKQQVKHMIKQAIKAIDSSLLSL